MAKKHRSIKADLAALIALLAEDPTQGEPLGNDCYKVRLSITSKGKGKSGGARVINCVVAKQQEVYLLTAYDKSEQASVSDAEIKAMIKQIP